MPGSGPCPVWKRWPEQADLILSILVPEAAVSLAEAVGKVLTDTGCRPVFADCNAVSPATSRRIEGIISQAGGRYLDASIIGPPPGQGQPPRFYVSGSHADAMCSTRRSRHCRQVDRQGDRTGFGHQDVLCRAHQGDPGASRGRAHQRRGPGALGRVEIGACLQPGPEAPGHGAGQAGAGQGLPLDRRNGGDCPAPSGVSASRPTSTPGRPRSSEWWRRATWEGSEPIRWIETARSRRPYPDWPKA